MTYDGFDPSELDWSRHLRGARHAVRGEGMFLAQFARALGRAAFDNWNDDEAEALHPLPHGDVRLPRPDVAFDGDAPVATVHQAFGPALHNVLSPAAWRDDVLKRKDQDEWLRSHVPDPEGGPPISALSLASRRGDDADEPITRGNWHAAWLMAEVPRFERRVAIEHMTLLADGIAELVLDGQIELLTQRVDGGPPESVPEKLWTGDNERRMRRLASCGFSVSDPGDASAEPTHFIFVAEDGRDEAIERWGEANHVPITWPHVPAADPLDELRMDVTLEIAPGGAIMDGELVMPERERVARFPDMERDVEEFLALALETNDSEGWRGPDLRRLVRIAFGKGRDGMADTARRSLAKQQRFAGLAIGGQPKKGARLVDMSDHSVRQIAARLKEQLKTSGRG